MDTKRNPHVGREGSGLENAANSSLAVEFAHQVSNPIHSATASGVGRRTSGVVRATTRQSMANDSKELAVNAGETKISPLLSVAESAAAQSSPRRSWSTGADKGVTAKARQLLSNLMLPEAADERHTQVQLSAEFPASKDVIPPKQKKKGVPVGSALQFIYIKERDKNLVISAWFLVYLLVFVALMTSIYNVHDAFGVNDALKDLFLDEEFPGAQYKKNFFEIMTHDELWQWLQGPVIAGAYPTQWYNEHTFRDNAERGRVLFNLRRVGGVQLRQLRVTSKSCTLTRESAMAAVNDTCYGPFSHDNEDRHRFGPFEWSSGWHQLDGFFGYGPIGGYGTGGYVVVLPNNATAAAAQLEAMRQARWTDEGTRAVAVMLNFYNPNTRTMSVMRLLVEFFNSGHIVKSYKFHTVRMEVYNNDNDYLRAVVEVIFGAMYLAYLGITMRKIVKTGPMWLRSFSNMYEVSMHVLVLLTLIEWLKFLSNPDREHFYQSLEADSFIDVYGLSQQYVETFTLASLVVLLYCLNFFRFFSINKRLNTLWLTLYHAAPDLAGFTLGFVILVSGFAVLAQYAYGSLLDDFHNFTSSFSTLLRFPLGDFSYESLSNTRPQVTGVFFAAYVAMVFLVCMNMIIGIISLYFNEVHSALQVEDAWQRTVDGLDVALVDAAVLGLHRVRSMLPIKYSPSQRALALVDRAAFMALLQELSDASEANAGVDLKSHLRAIYSSADPGQTMFVGEVELCTLSIRDQRDNCTHKTCLAAKFLTAYAKISNTMLFGHVKRSEGFKYKVPPITNSNGEISGSSWSSLTLCKCCTGPLRSKPGTPQASTTRPRRATQTDLLRKSSAFTGADDRVRFVVRKRGRHGYAGKRQLYLRTDDSHSPSMQVYDAQGRLRREYPLRLLAQMETSPSLQTTLSMHFHGTADVAAPQGAEGDSPLSPMAGGAAGAANGAGAGADGKPSGLKARGSENSVLNVEFETAELLQDFVDRCTEAVRQMQAHARAASAAATPRRQHSNARQTANHAAPNSAQPESATISGSIAQKLASFGRRAKTNVQERNAAGAGAGAAAAPASQAELARVMQELAAQRALLQRIMAKLDAS